MSGIDTLFPSHLATVQETADRALAAVGGEALLIGAGRLKYQFLDDRTEPFVSNPHFRHWAPILNAPGSFILHVPGRKPTVLFHQPEDYWHKPPSLPAGAWQTAFDIVTLKRPNDAKAFVPSGTVYVGEAFDEYAEWGFIGTNPPPLMHRLHYARAVKTPYELDCMREASRLGARAHHAAKRAFDTGASEYDIHLAYLAACGHTESELPYANIIALNEGGAVLHYTELGRDRPVDRRSLLIDAGAQYRGYASDITRTHAALPGPFADLVAAMDRVEQALCAMVKPGVCYTDIHLAAHRLIGQVLVEHRVIHCSVDTAVDARVTSVFFPHGIGHLLGLQVHDIGGHQSSEQGATLAPPTGHRYLRLTRHLEAGMVVTIEPGLYFIPLLLTEAHQDERRDLIDWSRVDALAPFGGVRIEDDVVATPTGPHNLTRTAFAALEA
jgi:Xaa-Pro dipeptidase